VLATPLSTAHGRTLTGHGELSKEELAELVELALEGRRRGQRGSAGAGAAGNKRNFLEVSGDIVERVDPIFFSNPMTAAMKALGMT
jgi:hypothetical protein